MKTIKLFATLFTLSLMLQSCGIYDLRTTSLKKEGITEENTTKGKQILVRAWKTQGFDKLHDHEVYSFEGTDVWKGLLGKMGHLWPELEAKMEFKYRVGTFDGQVHFTDGNEKGNRAGLQNWNYYESIDNKISFKDKDLKENKRKVFGIAAFQYFTEMADRLLNAPIVVYAGEDSFRDQEYDLVLSTWETEKPHEEHDQYLSWVNKETGMLDFVQYTIRDAYLKPPGYKLLGGAIEFDDFRSIDGVMIPHNQLVYAIKMKKNQDKFLHRLTVSDFEFDGFNPSDLIQDDKLLSGGNFKQ